MFQVGAITSAMRLDTNDWNRGVRNVQSGRKSMSAGLQSLMGVSTRLGIALGGLGASVLALSKKFITAGSDATETANLFKVSMGDMAKDAEKWMKSFSDSLGGIDDMEAKKMLGTFNLMIGSMGASEEGAYKMSKSLVQLAYDLTSLRNLEGGYEEAAMKLRSAMAGEIEPMRRLGVNITEVMIETWALSEGLVQNKNDITALMKSYVRYRIILEQTTKDQGDAYNTQLEFANLQRSTEANVAALGREIGNTLIPSMTEYLFGVKNAIIYLREWISNNQNLTAELAKQAVMFGIAATAASILLLLLPGISTGLGAILTVAGALAIAAWSTATAILASLAAIVAASYAVLLPLLAIGAAVYFLANLWRVNFLGMREVTAQFITVLSAGWERMKTFGVFVKDIFVATILVIKDAINWVARFAHGISAAVDIILAGGLTNKEAWKMASEAYQMAFDVDWVKIWAGDIKFELEGVRDELEHFWGGVTSMVKTQGGILGPALNAAWEVSKRDFSSFSGYISGGFESLKSYITDLNIGEAVLTSILGPGFMESLDPVIEMANGLLDAFRNKTGEKGIKLEMEIPGWEEFNAGLDEALKKSKELTLTKLGILTDEELTEQLAGLQSLLDKHGKTARIVTYIKREMAKVREELTGMRELTLGDLGIKTDEELTEQLDALQRLLDGYGKNERIAIRIKEEMAKVREELQGATEDVLTFSEALSAGFNDAVKRITDNILSMKDTISNGLVGLYSSMESGFARGFSGFVRGAQTASETMRNFIGTVIDGILQMVAKLIWQATVGKLLSMYAVKLGITNAAILAKAWAIPATLVSIATGGAAAVTGTAAVLGGVAITSATTAAMSGAMMGGGSGFATGIESVPRTGLYKLHENEKVVPRYDAIGAADTDGGRPLTIYNLLVPEDMANQIAASKSGRDTIVNIIRADAAENGPIRRMLQAGA